MADPTTVAQAQAQFNQYLADASAAEQAYNDTHDKLVASQQEVAATAAQINDQEAQVADLQNQVVQIALQQYQDNGMSATAAFLSSDSTEDLLYQVSTSQRLADVTNATIQQYQLGQADLTAKKAHLDQVTAGIAADDQKLDELQQQAQAKAADAKKILDQLKQADAQAAAARAAQQANAQAANPAAASAISTTPPSYTGDGSAASKVVSFALSKVGGPYVWGGNGPSGYDCSGLTRAAYLQVGISLPHNAAAQFALGTPVSTNDLRPGDLVFYYGGPSHVAIYIGNGQIVHASTYGVGIIVSSAFSMSVTGARRFL
jgi:cell wall-associated NlpC family hydrolase